MLPTTLWIAFALVIGIAQAGSYQGALERLWLYYAYEIDGLNPANEQTLGFNCVSEKDNKKSGWDRTARKCIGVWKSCEQLTATRDGSKRCNFNKLMESIGKVQKGTQFVPANPEGQDTKTPPIDETAINFYNYRVQKQIGGKVNNFGPWLFLKTTNGEYNDMIKQVGDRVVAAASHRAQNPDIFARFEEATQKIIQARRGDHGPYLIEAVQRKDWAKLQPGKNKPELEIKIEDLGRRPVPDPQGQPVEWKTVDWAATIEGSDDKKAAESRMNEFLSEYYSGSGSSGGESAADHRTVIRSYDTVLTRVRQCGR